MFKSTLVAALCTAIAFVAPALAGTASLTNQVYKETADGLRATAKVMPGDHVVYVLTYHNEGTKPTEAVVLTNPLPSGVEYTGPRDGSPPEVSVDGGRSFGALTDLTVAKDGAAQAPAGMADVTHLRWKLAKAVPAGGEARVSYGAKLK